MVPVCVFVCVYWYVNAGTNRGLKKVPDSPGTGVRGDRETPCVGAGNQFPFLLTSESST